MWEDRGAIRGDVEALKKKKNNINNNNAIFYINKIKRKKIIKINNKNPKHNNYIILNK